MFGSSLLNVTSVSTLLSNSIPISLTSVNYKLSIEHFRSKQTETISFISLQLKHFTSPVSSGVCLGGYHILWLSHIFPCTSILARHKLYLLDNSREEKNKKQKKKNLEIFDYYIFRTHWRLLIKHQTGYVNFFHIYVVSGVRITHLKIEMLYIGPLTVQCTPIEAEFLHRFHLKTRFNVVICVYITAEWSVTV